MGTPVLLPFNQGISSQDFIKSNLNFTNVFSKWRNAHFRNSCITIKNLSFVASVTPVVVLAQLFTLV